MKPEEEEPIYAVDIRKYTPEIQELIKEMVREFQSLSEQNFSRMIELCKSGAPCDFANKEELREFMKKVKAPLEDDTQRS